MKKSLVKLGLLLGAMVMLVMFAACPEPIGPGSSSSSVPSDASKVAGTFATYDVLASDMTQIDTFAVAEDSENFMFYYKFKDTFSGGVYLTTIGLADDSAGNITGNWDWGWSDTARKYGEAKNFVEFKIQLTGGYDAAKTLIDLFDNGNFQVLTNKGTEELKLVGNKVVDETMGDATATATILEIKVKKSLVAEFSGKTLNDLVFFVGKWGTWSMGVNGLTAGEFAPSDNVAGGTTISHYLKKDKTVVYRAGKTEGVVSFSPTSPFGLADYAAFAATNLVVSLIDVDNTNSTATVSVAEIITNVTNSARDLTLTYNADTKKFVANITFTSNTATGNQVQIAETDPTSLVLIYADASTTTSVTNSYTIDYTTLVTFWYTGVKVSSADYSGDVAMPCAANGWNNAAWTVTLATGAYSNNVTVSKSQLPKASGIEGKVVKSGSWDTVDGSGANVAFADFTGFDPATQGIKIDGSVSPITIAPYTK